MRMRMAFIKAFRFVDGGGLESSGTTTADAFDESLFV